MRFKSRHQESPEINLIPLMDVLMTVLTFFVVVSMTLNGEQTPNVALPGQSNSGQANSERANPRGNSRSSAPSVAQTLTVSLTASGELRLGAEQLDLAATTNQLRDRLRQNPQMVILLKADRSLPYKTIAKTLNTLRQVGGSRVSLITQ
jgi:biopolymer transport protein ExbD